MFKAFKYRIYPTREQESRINKHIGCCRFIYNLALEAKQIAWKGYGVRLRSFDLIKQIPDLKIDCPWLNEVNSQSLQHSVKYLDRAFNNFFESRGAYPVFKKKQNNGSFCVPQNVRIKGKFLTCPKFKDGIEIKLHRKITGTIRHAVISKSSTGKYFVSILCESQFIAPLKPAHSVIGIDLGLNSFLFTSEGEKIENPRFFRKAESRLKYLQRKYSRYKGKRTRKRVAIAHEKVANQRKDFLHKISTKLIRENQTVCVETLRIENMRKNHRLAKSISDASWRSFLDMLEYKSKWYDRNLLKIGTFEPSSKTCSCCGNINKELSLKDREWTCEECGTLLDRDLNAAINIKNFALRNLSVERRLKNRKELPLLKGALISEAELSLIIK